MSKLPGMPSRKRRLPTCSKCGSSEHVRQFGRGRAAKAMCMTHDPAAYLFPSRWHRRNKKPFLFA